MTKPPDQKALAPYLARLRELPFVRSLDASRSAVTDGIEAQRLRVVTQSAEFTLLVAHTRMNLGHPTVDRYLRQFEAHRGDWILFAPEISAPTGQRLAANSVNYVDLQGNCRLSLGDRYIALIEGRRAPRVTAHDKGMRLPGYQAMFALLAKPSLVREPLRTIAAEAEVSRQAVVDTLARLVHDRALFDTKRGYLWNPKGWSDAIDRWAVGYRDVVRPRLLVGRFHAQEQDPKALQERLRPILDTCGTWRWGGATAALRVAPHYQGERTVVHLEEVPSDLPRRLRAIPGRDGPLVILRTLGEVSLHGATPDTVHPLLAWAELLEENHDRAFEGAAELREKALLPP
jgi:hypothetical protein